MCTPAIYSIHFNRHPHCIFAASCRVALSISTDGHVLDRLLSRRFTCGVWTPSNTFPWAHLAPTSRPVHVAHRDSAANRALHSSRSRQRVTSPSKLTFTWGSEAPSNTWFLGPTRVHNPNGNGHLDRFCRFSRPDDRDRPTDILTDRQTDIRQCLWCCPHDHSHCESSPGLSRNSVCSDTPHLRSTAMRPKKLTLQTVN